MNDIKLPVYIIENVGANADGILCSLIESLSETNGYCTYTKKYLAKQLNVDERAIARRVHKLIDNEHIINHGSREKWKLTYRNPLISKG